MSEIESFVTKMVTNVNENVPVQIGFRANILRSTALLPCKKFQFHPSRAACRLSELEDIAVI